MKALRPLWFSLFLLLLAIAVCLPACKEEKKRGRKNRDRTHQKKRKKKAPKEKKKNPQPERVEGYDKPQSADPDWTAGSVEYADKSALYTAAIVVEEAIVYPNPEIIAGSAIRLPEGHLLEVLDTTGPKLALDERNQTALPIRVLGHIGWVFKSQLRKIPPLAVTPDKLWASLWAQGKPGARVPKDCQIRTMLAEMSEIPGEEIVIFGGGMTQCGKALGVFTQVDGVTTLLASRFDLETTTIQVRRHIRGRAFLDVTAYWMGGPALMGDRQYLLGLAGDNGPLDVFFEIDKAVVDSSSQPARYLLSQVAFPDPDGNGDWYIQHKFVERLMVNAKGQDTTTETFYKWGGQAFVEVDPPAGATPLPDLGSGLGGPPPDGPGIAPGR